MLQRIYDATRVRKPLGKGRFLNTLERQVGHRLVLRPNAAPENSQPPLQPVPNIEAVPFFQDRLRRHPGQNHEKLAKTFEKP